MIAITSPAKTQDFDTKVTASISTQPEFKKKADILARKLQSFSKKELKKLMGISDKLTELNYERFSNWNKAEEKESILAYKGDIYRQFDANSFTKTEEEYIQSHLRIITGMYGILRPYDLMKPYRLEMKTKVESLSLNESSLQNFWKEDITKSLNSALGNFSEESRILLNLASNEYVDAVDRNLLEARFIDVGFRQKKDGQIVNLGIYAKFARGLVIKFMVENSITSLKDIKSFNLDGYRLHSESDKEIIFIKSV